MAGAQAMTVLEAGVIKGMLIKSEKHLGIAGLTRGKIKHNLLACFVPSAVNPFLS
jgi:hypothetical protein